MKQKRIIMLSFHAFSPALCFIKIMRIMQLAAIMSEHVLRLFHSQQLSTLDHRTGDQVCRLIRSGIAADSARTVPEGFFLLHDSRKLCALSRKSRIVPGPCDSRAFSSYSILVYVYTLPYKHIRNDRKAFLLIYFINHDLSY